MPTDDELASRARRRLGTTLKGKYRLDRVLGIGGMAVVYKATHRNAQQFAVKMLHEELSVRSDIRTRFLREGYVANSVKHRGAVAVLDDDVDDNGAAFLVMEMLHGETLDVLVRRSGGKLQVRAALSIADQLLDVLVAAHANAIVHRDVKPANLFVCKDGTLKVLDFGVARLRDPSGSGGATNTGSLLGTPAYMPPEQALGEVAKIDAQTDLWAAGATLFAMLAGRTVHEGDTAQKLMIAAGTKPAPRLASVAPEIPEDIAAVVDRALLFEKAERWGSASAMRDALKRCFLVHFGERPSALEITAASESAPPGPDSSGMLSPLARSTGFGHDSTLAAPGTPVTPPPPASAEAPGLGTTTRPFAERASAKPEEKRRGAMLWGLAALLVVLATGVLMAQRHETATGADVMREAGLVATEKGTAKPAPVESAPAAVTASATSEVARSDAGVIAAGVDAGAVVSGGGRRGRGAAASASARASASATASASAPAGATASAGAAKAGCTPPFYYDESGTKIWKHECF